jgi:hypothetical protein
MSTTTAAPRRRVRYQNLDELLADVEQAVRVNAPTTGNWSLGRIVEHLAIAIDKTIDGFGFQAPWPLPLVGGLLYKKKLLRDGLRPGFKLSPKATQVLIPDETDVQQALAHLRRSVERLRTHNKSTKHPFLGRLTADESLRLQLRHAELHMSFVAVPPA